MKDDSKSDELNSNSGSLFQIDEDLSPEHVDKLRLQDIRSEFYHYNTEFEQILKFKPVRHVDLSNVEINLE